MNTQNPIQTNPIAPMMMNAISQPNAFARGGIVAGATKAPMDAPALKIDVANARSFFGKYSAVVLIAAGKLPASPSARTARAARKSHTLTDDMAKAAAEPVLTARIVSTLSYPFIFIVAQPQSACAQAPSDHIPIAQRYPFFVPIQSTNLPANSIAIA